MSVLQNSFCYSKERSLYFKKETLLLVQHLVSSVMKLLQEGS